MRAIISSIHSQVPQTVADLELRFELIVSMDSHLDVSFGRDDALYPKELRVIARRTGAHTALRGLGTGFSTLDAGEHAGDLPNLVVAMPQSMLAAHAIDIESQIPPSLRIRNRKGAIASSVDFLAKTMGIEVYQSPPKKLEDLVRRSASTEAWLLDLDVDYMHEMQNECYTRIIRPSPGVLQSASSVLGFIEKAKPETITLSEAKVSAIRNPKSAFSRFMADLKDAGYMIEERGIFASDAEVIKGISVCKEFYQTVSKVLMIKHMREMLDGDFEGFQAEEEVAAKEFFRGMGYSE
jgi:hypothetical protein